MAHSTVEELSHQAQRRLSAPRSAYSDTPWMEQLEDGEGVKLEVGYPVHVLLILLHLPPQALTELLTRSHWLFLFYLLYLSPCPASPPRVRVRQSRIPSRSG